MTDDNGIIVAGGDPAAEPFAILGFKVLFRRNKDIGSWVELQEFACPLFGQVIGNHEQGLLAQSQPLTLHGGGDHLEGLARTNHMSQQRVAAVEDMGNRVHLMLSQRDLRIHSGKVDMAAIIFSGAIGVEQDVIGLAQGFPSRRVFPDPFCKGFFEQLLLTLGDGSFFLVQDRDFLPLSIILIIKNTNILQIQAVLHDLVGVDAFGAIGAVRLDIAAILALTFNAPFASDFGIMDFDAPLRASGRTQRFKKELLDIRRVQPRCAQPDRDLAGGEVYWLHLGQSISIDLIP